MLTKLHSFKANECTLRRRIHKLMDTFFDKLGFGKRLKVLINTFDASSGPSFTQDYVSSVRLVRYCVGASSEVGFIKFQSQWFSPSFIKWMNANPNRTQCYTGPSEMDSIDGLIGYLSHSTVHFDEDPISMDAAQIDEHLEIRPDVERAKLESPKHEPLPIPVINNRGRDRILMTHPHRKRQPAVSEIPELDEFTENNRSFLDKSVNYLEKLNQEVDEMEMDRRWNEWMNIYVEGKSLLRKEF